MKYIYFFGVAIFFLLTLSCKKEAIISNQKQAPVAAKTREKGLPDGVAVSKTLGAAGGTIISGDERLKLIIPAGALMVNTVISIQPIASTLPLSLGNAYRIMPEGIHFEKPITISFNYDDEEIEGSLPALLKVGYQDSAGVWKSINKLQFDTTLKTVSAKSMHFSDWSIFFGYKLQVSSKIIGYNKTCALSVIYNGFELASASPDETGIADTTHIPGSIEDWELIGDGVLKSAAEQATYTSPASKPSKNPVEINVKIEAIPTGSNQFSKLILIEHIYVADSYMTVVFKKQTNSFIDCDAFVLPDGTGIAGYGKIVGGSGSVHLTVSANKAGTYQFGDVNKLPNQCYMELQFLDGRVVKLYRSEYIKCNETKPTYMSGSTIIEYLGPPDTYIDGSFKGTIVSAGNNCEIETQPIHGIYHARRSL